MSSTTYFSWLEPIALTDQTLKAFDERLRRYGVLARRDMVARHDLNPDEVQTPDDAMKLHAESGRWRFESIAKEMPKIESVRWAVTFQNGIRRSGMNLNEILDLPNAGDSTITSLSGSSGALGYTAEVQFSVSRSWPSKIEFSGDYIHVQAFKDELSQLLNSSTRNWSIVTKGWVGFLVAAAFVIAVFFALGFLTVRIGEARDWSVDVESNWIIACLAVTTIIWIVVGGPISTKWREIFPLVEFQFGGGVNAADARRKWRRVAWSVPVLLIEYPLLINVISDWLMS